MKIKVNFLNCTFNEKEAFELCAEYSENADLLKNWLESNATLKIDFDRVQNSHWNAGLLCVAWKIDLNGFKFNFFGSHRDAEIIQEGVFVKDSDWPNSASKTRHCKVATRKALQKICNDILYSVLCSIGSDLLVLDCEPEDLGLNSDSIKDVAKWNEWKEHARQLRKHLPGLSEEVLQAFPS